MKHYPSRYPRSGQKAILCEGDLAGYEVDMLESWTAAFPDVGLVDVWPCGTKTAIFGMADAIGRAIPVFVIEDRDHRSHDVAVKDCRRSKKDRTGRSVKIGGWTTWNRSEIENYLVEPVVLVPTFSEVFDTTEEEVSQRLQEILKDTACDQSLQFALSEFRATFPNGEKEVGGVSRQDGRPRWGEHGLILPKPEKVATLLREVLLAANARLAPERQPNPEKFVERFDQRLEKWKSMKIEDEEWRIDWAGKEILGWLRIRMSAEFGWPEGKNPDSRIPIKWESLTKSDYGEMDRRIEYTLQERLVKRFLKSLRTTGVLPTTVCEEWMGIIGDLRTSV